MLEFCHEGFLESSQVVLERYVSSANARHSLGASAACCRDLGNNWFSVLEAVDDLG